MWLARDAHPQLLRVATLIALPLLASDVPVAVSAVRKTSKIRSEGASPSYDTSLPRSFTHSSRKHTVKMIRD